MNKDVIVSSVVAAGFAGFTYIAYKLITRKETKINNTTRSIAEKLHDKFGNNDIIQSYYVVYDKTINKYIITVGSEYNSARYEIDDENIPEEVFNNINIYFSIGE